MALEDFRITLKAARVNAGLRLLDAAEKLGVGKDTLIRWEKEPGNVQAKYQKIISDTYKIPIDRIFFA